MPEFLDGDPWVAVAFAVAFGLVSLGALIGPPLGLETLRGNRRAGWTFAAVSVVFWVWVVALVAT